MAEKPVVYAASPPLDPEREQRFWRGIEETGKFFLGESKVHQALHKLVAALEQECIPYAIVGAMALNEYGYHRATVDVDVLLTSDGLEAFKRAHLGRGYLEKFPGSRSLRDSENRVDIDVLLAGSFPGDGKPKPVMFPDPAAAALRGSRVALLPIARMVELKLASGLSAPHRLRDLADVLELIRAAALPEDLGLDPSVRDKYGELWRAAQTADKV